MKIASIILTISLTTLMAPVHCKPIQESSGNPVGMLDLQKSGRLLLVAFSDGTIGSLKSTASPSSYRQRGDYQSSSWSERISTQLADEYELSKLTEWPMTEVGQHCVVYSISDGAKLAETIARIAKDKRVDIVQSMNSFNTRAQLSNDPYVKLQTNLDQMQIGQAHHIATGKSIIIGMIDTGVDLGHPDLIGQISDNKNLAEDVSSSFSTDKHGTAVAGVMVAKKNNATGIMGISPSAKLLALKACWPDQVDAMDAVCNSYTLAQAVNTAIKEKVNVLNMSLTGPQDPLLELLINKAMEKGIIVVAADTGKEVNFPASLKGVISVQSIKGNGTATNTLVETISAPGDQVLTTLPHGTYDFISGSSIAAAEISGIVALLLEINPDLSASEADVVLRKAKMLTKEGFLSGINANNALNTLCKSKTCTKEVLGLAMTTRLF